MRVLVFGGGELANRFAKITTLWGSDDITVLTRRDCDVTEYASVCHAVNRANPDFIVCTAGLSDRRIGVSIEDVLDANLLGPMNVGTAAAAYKVPCLLVASTAGISPGTHKWYGPAKAGVINFVRAMANDGHEIWAVSPGRMDTRMREDDFPGEDPETRLSTGLVASLMIDVIRGRYAPGANVVIRKVGTERTDVYEEVATCLPSLL